VDPLFHDNPEVQAALAAAPEFTPAHRDDLLKLHDRLLAEVIPAYRALAERGQVELAESPYYHPILPLLIDIQSARRARPEMSLPSEPFAAPDDARRHVERALARHERAFGRRPQGMWPAEGSVSPEAAEIFASAGVRWLATDEGVLWQSLPPEARTRAALYRPWSFATPSGQVVLFFRDHELSDRIGFVYHHWRAEDAVADFLGRIRRIGEEHRGTSVPVVSVILDGENCWEYYPEDGGPFLDALYTALENAPDIRTRTPSEVIADSSAIEPLAQLHSGSWINADFKIWIGHPEKNRAWDLLSRARRALVESSGDGSRDSPAWESLSAAEGSDWFWWFGDDHYTADKAVFDRLFREHLHGAYERAGLASPGWLQVPIAQGGRRARSESQPSGFIRPTLDGKRTQFYEWHAAAQHRLGAGGGSMHRGAGLAEALYFGFDPRQLYVRLDFANGRLPGPEVDLVFEVLAPRPMRIRVNGLDSGERDVLWEGGEHDHEPVGGSRCAVANILELGIPFASLGVVAGESVEILGTLVRDGAPIETLPADDLIRFAVPDESFESAMWSA